MGSLACYAYCGKEMLGWICEKMATLESTPRSGKFFAFGSITTRNSTSTYNDLCAPGGNCSTDHGNSSWDNAHTSDSSSKGKRLGSEQSTLLQRAQRTSGSSNG